MLFSHKKTYSRYISAVVRIPTLCAVLIIAAEAVPHVVVLGAAPVVPDVLVAVPALL